MFRREFVPVADVVCGLCGKSPTGGKAALVYRHSYLPPVYDGRGGGVFTVYSH